MATCTDTDGSFTCQCQNGYTGNGQNCTGENETFTEYYVLGEAKRSLSDLSNQFDANLI